MPTQRPPISLLSVVANIERHKIASGEPFLFLFCLQYPGTANPTATQQYVRLVRDNNPITFDAGDGNGPQEYTPFNFSLGEISISSTGAVPELELKASNVMRALQSTLEQYAGAVGGNLTLFVVNTANPAGEAELAMNFTVKQSVADAMFVTMKLGASSPMRRLFPLFMYRPNFCCWQYKSAQCGYTGTIPTCSKTIDGTTGCQAHFPSSPLRGLFFPGIDSNGASVASVA